MDMQEMLDTKRNVAGLFDARQRQVIRIALVRRRATLERMAGTLSEEGVASPDLVEQLVVIRGAEAEYEEQAFPGHDMGVLAAFKEITMQELAFEAERRQGDLFTGGEDRRAETAQEPAEAAIGAEAAEETVEVENAAPGETQPAGEAENEAGTDENWEMVVHRCPECGIKRAYPAGETPGCPFGCTVHMVRISAAGEDLSESDATEDVAVTDTIRAQRLEERPEFSSRRPINALQEARIYRVGELIDRVDARGRGSLAQIRGLGQKGRREALALFDAVFASLNGSAPSSQPAAKTQQAEPTPEINAALQDCIPAGLSAESSDDNVLSMLRQVWPKWMENAPDGVSIEMIPGDHVHRTLDGRHVLCYVYVSESDLEPRWWYDYDPNDPNGFDPEDVDYLPPTLRGAQLVAAVRALLGAGEATEVAPA